ncbi:caspase family protein [Myxococcota bacterium]|nr:caspase family protein [Myxococcota bacterium]
MNTHELTTDAGRAGPCTLTFRFLLVIAFVVSLVAEVRVALGAETPAPLRRFAYIVAANDGGPGRAVLRYAVSDAKTFAGVLRELGGVEAGDQVLAIEPTRAQLEAGFRDLSQRITAAKETASRVELLVYYSGHSNENGLLLGRDLVSYPDLRAALDAVPADVRIAILDSCASGAITRLKGGKHRAPFLADQSTQVKGYAVLTSSSEDEAAQESDRIGASFFTHFLVSGLRGAADLSSDGRVTLNEAYHFAFHETLARTARTLSGPQHPAYDIQLAGSGDLVMTDIRATSAGLTLPEELFGRIHLRDASGRLVAELDKPAGRVIELGLAPGEYEVLVDQKGTRHQGAVALREGARTPLVLASMKRVDAELTAARGDATGDRNYHYLPVDVGLFPPLSMAAAADAPVRTNFSFGLVLAADARVDGLALGALGSWIDDALVGAQISGAFNHAGAGTSGAQISGAVNVTDHLDGVQVAGAVNVAGDVRGLQTSGLVNAADEISGAQVGIINVGGEVTGAQIGLVNVSSKIRGPAIGLVNYSSDDGWVKPTLFASDTGLASVGLRVSSSTLYTMFAVSTSMPWNLDAWGYGLALGGRIPLSETLHLDIDGSAWSVHEDRTSAEAGELLSTTRVLLGWQITPGLAIYAGPSLHTLTELRDRLTPANLAPSYAWKPSDDVRMWVGGTIGLELN